VIVAMGLMLGTTHTTWARTWHVMPAPRELLAVSIEEAELQPRECCESAQIQVQRRKDAVTIEITVTSAANECQLPTQCADVTTKPEVA